MTAPADSASTAPADSAPTAPPTPPPAQRDPPSPPALDGVEKDEEDKKSSSPDSDISMQVPEEAAAAEVAAEDPRYSKWQDDQAETDDGRSSSWTGSTWEGDRWEAWRGGWHQPAPSADIESMLLRLGQEYDRKSNSDDDDRHAMEEEEDMDSMTKAIIQAKKDEDFKAESSLGAKFRRDMKLNPQYRECKTHLQKREFKKNWIDQKYQQVVLGNMIVQTSGEATCQSPLANMLDFETFVLRLSDSSN